MIARRAAWMRTLYLFAGINLSGAVDSAVEGRWWFALLMGAVTMFTFLLALRCEMSMRMEEFFHRVLNIAYPGEGK